MHASYSYSSYSLRDAYRIAAAFASEGKLHSAELVSSQPGSPNAPLVLKIRFMRDNAISEIEFSASNEMGELTAQRYNAIVSHLTRIAFNHPPRPTTQENDTNRISKKIPDLKRILHEKFGFNAEFEYNKRGLKVTPPQNSNLNAEVNAIFARVKPNGEVLVSFQGNAFNPNLLEEAYQFVKQLSTHSHFIVNYLQLQSQSQSHE